MRRCLLFFALFACTKQEATQTPQSKPTMSQEANQDWMGFPVYPNTRTLCVEHITGNNMHILWRTYASKDSPEKVVAFYQPGSKEKNLTLDGDKDLKLSVFPVSEAGNYPSCEKTANQDEQTIIFVSQAIR